MAISTKQDGKEAALCYDAHSHMVCAHTPFHLLTEAPEQLPFPAHPHIISAMFHLHNPHINISYFLPSSQGTARRAWLCRAVHTWPHSSVGDDSVARKCRLTGRMQHQQETCPGVMRTRCCAARAARGQHAAGLCQHGLALILAAWGGQSRDGFIFLSLLQQTVLHITHCICSVSQLGTYRLLFPAHRRYLHQVQHRYNKSTKVSRSASKQV